MAKRGKKGGRIILNVIRKLRKETLMSVVRYFNTISRERTAYLQSTTILSTFVCMRLHNGHIRCVSPTDKSYRIRWVSAELLNWGFDRGRDHAIVTALVIHHRGANHAQYFNILELEQPMARKEK